VTSQPVLLEPDWHTAYKTAYGCAQPTSTQSVRLDAAVGRILARDVCAPMSLPRDTTSAMDGWAVGGPVGPWRVVGSESLAGHPSDRVLGSGEAMGIATGGVIPAGTFGVLRREFARVDEQELLYSTSEREPFALSHVRPAGAEALTGEVVISAGTRLSPAQVGLAAMLGLDSLEVAVRPSCQVFILGDEVLRSGVPSVGQVRDAFEPQLPAYGALLGLDVVGVEFVADSLDATTAALERSSADVVISTGGTAAGPKDFFHSALAAVGGELIIDSIAMRPGHPNVLARRDGQRGAQFIVGLPGNPLSACLGGMLTLVRPLAAALTGEVLPAFGQAIASNDMSAPAHDTRLVPCSVQVEDARTFATETKWLNSGMLRGLASCDVVAIVPPGGARAGEIVSTLALPWR